MKNNNLEILNEIYEKYKNQIGHGDKGTAHSYIETYENLFYKYKNKNINLLEIGVFAGLSIKMWSEYFENGNIFGVDIDLKNCETDTFSYKNVNLFEFDIINEDKIKNIFKGKKFDIIIDDGSHILSDQIQSFIILENYMNEGGIYVIEDIKNIDTVFYKFKELNSKCEPIDLRHQRLCDDNSLIVYRF